jgi:hypothetical protein
MCSQWSITCAIKSCHTKKPAKRNEEVSHKFLLDYSCPNKYKEKRQKCGSQNMEETMRFLSNHLCKTCGKKKASKRRRHSFVNFPFSAPRIRPATQTDYTQNQRRKTCHKHGCKYAQCVHSISCITIPHSTMEILLPDAIVV